MKNKKKYIIITPFFPNTKSHIGSYVYDQARTIFSLSDYQVEIIKVVSIWSLEKDYVFKGLKVYIFRVLDLPFFILPGIFNFINSIRIVSFIKNRFNTNNLKIVHGHVSYPSVYLANILSDKFRIKTIAQHHGFDILQLLNGRSSLISNLQRKYVLNQSIQQLNLVDLNVFVSKRIKNELCNFPQYQPRNEYILYNGVDRNKFYPLSNKVSCFFEIGCIANFWPIKDHISLIKAVEMLVKDDGYDDIILRLIGKGETLNYCHNYVLENKLDQYVVFEEERSHEKLNCFYNEIDLFVLPSYYEALGCVLLEAWATNTPIISIKNQGIEELLPINELDDLLAEKRDPKSLKEKIIGQYKRKRKFIFNENYNINNTIKDFLSLDIFAAND